MAKGQQGIFAGVDAAGNRVADNDTISDDFKELDRGRWFSLVNEDGAMERWRLRGWLMVVAADYPQAQAMGPYMEGCQAKCLCRGCNYEREQASVHSFFEPNAKWKLVAARAAPPPPADSRLAPEARRRGDAARGHQQAHLRAVPRVLPLHQRGALPRWLEHIRCVEVTPARPQAAPPRRPGPSRPHGLRGGARARSRAPEPPERAPPSLLAHHRDAALASAHAPKSLSRACRGDSRPPTGRPAPQTLPNPNPNPPRLK